MLISTAGALPTTNDNNKLSQIFTEISSDILQAIIKFLFIMKTNKSVVLHHLPLFERSNILGVLRSKLNNENREGNGTPSCNINMVFELLQNDF